MIKVDYDLCGFCHYCADICPFGAITYPIDFPEISDKCQECKKCIPLCIMEALYE